MSAVRLLFPLPRGEGQGEGFVGCGDQFHLRRRQCDIKHLQVVNQSVLETVVAKTRGERELNAAHFPIAPGGAMSDVLV